MVAQGVGHPFRRPGYHFHFETDKRNAALPLGRDQGSVYSVGRLLGEQRDLCFKGVLDGLAEAQIVEHRRACGTPEQTGGLLMDFVKQLLREGADGNQRAGFGA